MQENGDCFICQVARTLMFYCSHNIATYIHTQVLATFILMKLKCICMHSLLGILYIGITLLLLSFEHAV